MRQLEKDVQEQKDSLDRNYGEQEEFRSLEGQCLDYHDHEYTYRLCPFDRVSSVPRYVPEVSIYYLSLKLLVWRASMSANTVY